MEKLNPKRTYIGYKMYRGRGIMPISLITKRRISATFEVVKIFTSKKEANDWLMRGK